MPDLEGLLGNVAPNVSVGVYSLGRTDRRWTNAFLTGNISLGNALIGSTGAVVTLPAGSTVGGIVIGTGAGGSETQIQFNSNTFLAGSANLTFDGNGVSSRYFRPIGSTGPIGSIFSGAGNSVAVSGNLQIPEISSFTVENNYYPVYRPVLYNDFIRFRRLDSRFVVLRDSTASYYDGKTTMVMEENQYLQSQVFEANTVWSYSTNVSITINSTTAPDGTVTAESFVLPAEARNHFFQQTGTTLVPNNIYTTSIFAKANQRRYLQISVANNAEMFINFDLQTGSITFQQGQINGSIINYGNSWYRCTASYMVIATNRYAVFSVVANAQSVVRESFTPTASDSIYIWGAQLEKKANVTDYQITTTNRIVTTAPCLMFAVNNEPRFDHDPITGVCRGLLIEDQKANLLNYSQFFANTQYTKTGGSIRSAAMTAPDGTLTFDRFVEDTSTGTHGISESLGSLSSADYTLSIFVKPVNRTWVQLGWNDGSTDRAAYFDLSSGNVGTVAGGATTMVQAVGNSIYRVSVSHQSNVATVFVRGATANGTNSYTGNANNGYYLWGIQLEAGPYMTSYIPNVGNTTLTRPVDTITTTINGFKEWYNPVEGTVYVEASSFGNVFYTTQNTSATIGGNIVYYPDAAHYIYYVDISNGTTQNGINLRHPGIGYINQYNVEYFYANIGSSTTKNTVIKTALSYASNNTIHARDGIIGTLDTNVALPDLVDRMTIGNRGNLPTTNGPLNGHLRKIIYWPERLTANELITITKTT